MLNIPTYPEERVAPFRHELTSIGFEELKTPQEVEAALHNSEGTVLVVVNSVCGCAAGMARPGVKMALNDSEKKPNKLTSVFAGMEKEAVAKAREYFLPYPPSSPSIALFKDGKLVHFIERHQIEGHSADMIADDLMDAFKQYC